MKLPTREHIVTNTESTANKHVPQSIEVTQFWVSMLPSTTESPTNLVYWPEQAPVSIESHTAKPTCRDPVIIDYLARLSSYRPLDTIFELIQIVFFHAYCIWSSGRVESNHVSNRPQMIHLSRVQTMPTLARGMGAHREMTLRLCVREPMFLDGFELVV